MPSINKITTRAITGQEREQVLEFLRNHYYLEEPLTVSGDGPKQPDKEDEDFNLSNIEHGTCFMAVQETATDLEGKIVGAILAGPKGPNEAVHLFEEAANLGATKWGQILYFLACIERDANIFQRFNVQKALHVHVLAAHKQMRGQQLGARLLQQILNLAKHLNYDMVTADCTSFYSARLFERMGFQCVNVKYYKDYKDAAGKQIYQPEFPHECVKTFVFKL